MIDLICPQQNPRHLTQDYWKCGEEVPPCPNEAQVWVPLHPPLRTYIYIYIYIHTCVYEHITIYTDDHMPCIARESGFLLGMCAMRATSTRGFLVNVPFTNRERAGLSAVFCTGRARAVLAQRLRSSRRAMRAERSRSAEDGKEQQTTKTTRRLGLPPASRRASAHRFSDFC